ncbi:hypothetical protein FEM21_06980 [Flavobacterium seoulense]|uniref:Uncharacterized protein n=1 Tax=Flavobacterium seoulense TaxID=1492738 RepID=A0A066WQM1_9FLAO|nr:hypothetical protein FEM21_06980 [Flavobacterium seoulense]
MFVLIATQSVFNFSLMNDQTFFAVLNFILQKEILIFAA